VFFFLAATMQPIHERMPVILEKEDLAAWIAPVTKLETALAMLKPCSTARMVAYPRAQLRQQCPP